MPGYSRLMALASASALVGCQPAPLDLEAGGWGWERSEDGLQMDAGLFSLPSLTTSSMEQVLR